MEQVQTSDFKARNLIAAKSDINSDNLNFTRHISINCFCFSLLRGTKLTTELYYFFIEYFVIIVSHLLKLVL